MSYITAQPATTVHHGRSGGDGAAGAGAGGGGSGGGGGGGRSESTMRVPGTKKEGAASTGTVPYVHSYALHVPGLKVGEAPKRLPNPRRPFGGGHSIAEAGGSVCAPKVLVLVMRAVFLMFAVGALVRSAVDKQLQYTRFPTYAFCAFTAAMLLVTMCSLRYAATRSVDASAQAHFQGSTYAWLANIAVPVYQIAISAALFIPPLYWPFLHKSTETLTFSVLAVNALPLAVMFADFFLTARMRFKIFYAVVFEILVVVYLIVLWLLASNGTDIYSVLNPKGSKSPSKVILYYVGIGIWGAVAAMVMYFLSLLFACTRREADEDEQRYLRDKRLFGDDMHAASILAIAKKDSERYRNKSTADDITFGQDLALDSTLTADHVDPELGPQRPRRGPSDTHATIASSTSVDNTYFPPVEPVAHGKDDGPREPSFPPPGATVIRSSRERDATIPEYAGDPRYHPCDNSLPPQHPPMYNPAVAPPELPMAADPQYGDQYLYAPSAPPVQSYAPPPPPNVAVAQGYPEPPNNYMYTSYAFDGAGDKAPPPPPPPTRRR